MGLIVALAGAHFAGTYLRNVSSAYTAAFERVAADIR